MVNIIIPYFKKMQKYMSQRPCITAIYPHVWQFNSQVSWLVFMNLSSFTMNMKYTQTAQKIKFSIKDIFSECDQIGRKLQIWSHCWKKSLMENFFFFVQCQVQTTTEKQTAHNNYEPDIHRPFVGEHYFLIQDDFNMASPWKMKWINMTSTWWAEQKASCGV